jgi:membrane protein implicated in regulation of membrane protease activity
MEGIALWVVVALVALAIDAATSAFIFAGFTVGGIAAIIAQAIGSDFTTQLIVFMVVSIVAIVLEYTWFRKLLKKNIPKTPRMEEEYIGRKITAEEDIESRSKVKIEGIYWTVENAGSIVRKGEKAEIVAIKGNKLIIKK